MLHGVVYRPVLPLLSNTTSDDCASMTVVWHSLFESLVLFCMKASNEISMCCGAPSNKND